MAEVFFVLLVAPPWDWKNPSLMGVRAGILPDLTPNEFDDDFQNGIDKWYRRGNCASIQTGQDAGGSPINYLHMSPDCWAIAKMTSDIDGFHPLSRAPGMTHFWAEFVVRFESGDQIALALHTATIWSWLRPVLREKRWGDRLTIERLPQPSNNKISLKLNCSSGCPSDQSAVLTSSVIREPINTITIIVTSLKGWEGWYFVQVTPDRDPYMFDQVDGAAPKPKLRGSSRVGGIGLLANKGENYKVSSVTIRKQDK